MKKKSVVMISMLLCAALAGGCGGSEGASGQETAADAAIIEETEDTLSESGTETAAEGSREENPEAEEDFGEAGESAAEADQAEAPLPDGTYMAKFQTDSSMAKPLSAYRLGESYAQNLGVNLKLLRIWLVVSSSILSACIVAFAGPVSFVGIATPHLVKKLLGTAEPILMIPACFLGGSVFCLFCDLLARTMLAPTELSISTVTAIFGAPVVLWIMTSRNKHSG